MDNDKRNNKREDCPEAVQVLGWFALMIIFALVLGWLFELISWIFKHAYDGLYSMSGEGWIVFLTILIVFWIISEKRKDKIPREKSHE